MENRTNANLSPRLRAKHLTLHPTTIEKVFTESVVVDLGQVLVLDSIDILPDSTGFRVRSHDLHGPLPDIVIKDSGDTFLDKENFGNRVSWLVAITQIRNELVCYIPKGKLLPPTSIDSKAVVGFRAGRRAWLAEGKDFLAAYHELHRQVVG